MPPGDYVVSRTACKGKTFNGPHARFQVRPREVVNIGKLRLEHKQIDRRTGELRRYVEPLAEETIEILKKRIPRTYARMTTRPMALVKAAAPPQGAQRQPGPTSQNAGPKTKN